MINITLGRAFAIGIVAALAMGILIEGASAGERERQAVIKQQIEAEYKAKMEVKRVRREAEEKAERERMERERKAEEEKIKAQKEREEAERKAADVEHRRSVNNAALAAMIESGIDEKCAKRVIVLVASEKIPGMPVNY